MKADKAKQGRTILQLLALSRAAVGCKHKYPSQTLDRHMQVWHRQLEIPAPRQRLQERETHIEQAPRSAMGACSAAKVRVGVGARSKFCACTANARQAARARTSAVIFMLADMRFAGNLQCGKALRLGSQTQKARAVTRVGERPSECVGYGSQVDTRK